jgi:hypothetical protein
VPRGEADPELGAEATLITAGPATIVPLGPIIAAILLLVAAVIVLIGTILAKTKEDQAAAKDPQTEVVGFAPNDGIDPAGVLEDSHTLVTDVAGSASDPIPAAAESTTTTTSPPEGGPPAQDAGAAGTPPARTQQAVPAGNGAPRDGGPNLARTGGGPSISTPPPASTTSTSTTSTTRGPEIRDAGAPPRESGCPATAPIKAVITAGTFGPGVHLFYVPEHPGYANAIPVWCFTTTAGAEAAGYHTPPSPPVR